MATLLLTAAEVKSIRALIGTDVTESALSDEQIQSDVICGEAVDETIGAVIAGLTGLTAAQQTAVAHAYTAPATFISSVLNAIQTRRFRRAIVYLAASLATPMVPLSRREAGIDVSREVNERKWEARQAFLLSVWDDHIKSIRDDFPVPPETQGVPPSIITLLPGRC